MHGRKWEAGVRMSMLVCPLVFRVFCCGVESSITNGASEYGLGDELLIPVMDVMDVLKT